MSTRYGIICAAIVLSCGVVPSLTHTARQGEPEIAETIRQLRTIHVTEETVTEVPQGARMLLKVLKRQLRDVIAATLDDRSATALKPEEIRGDVLNHLKAQGIDIGSPESSDPAKDASAYDFYGYVNDVRVERPEEHPDLLVAETSLLIPYGDDSSLYVFQYNSGTWKLILEVEVNGYEEISGAPGWLSYKVSPPDERGDWFVVTADITPWPTSFWQGLRVKALRPGTTASSPQMLLSEALGVYLGCEPAYQLEVNREGFRLSFAEFQGLDPGILIRTHLRNYRVAGNTVTRVPPLAALPQDSLDEWVEMPWEQAARWIEGSEQENLKSWHDKLNQKSKQREFMTQFDFVQGCEKWRNPPMWVLGLYLEDMQLDAPPPGLPSELFFTMILRDGAFYLQGVSTNRPPGCPGESDPISSDGCGKLP